MRKYLSLQILVLIVCCILPRSIYAQFGYTPCEVCLAGEPEKKYDPPQTLSEVVGGCVFEITYQKRRCDYAFDMKIQKIRITSGSCPYPIEQLISIAIGRMIFNNHMAFPPFQNKEGAVWNLMKPRCWKYSGQPCTEKYSDIPNPHPSGGATEFVACDTSQCCVNMMHAYRNECGELQIRDMNVEMFMNPEFHQQYLPNCHCAEMPEHPAPPACIFNCNRSFIETYLRNEAAFGL